MIFLIKNQTIRMKSLIGILCLTILPSILSAVELPLQLSTLKAPIPVSTIDGTLLVYELELKNITTRKLHVGLIQVMDDAGNILESYSGKRLQENSFVYQDNKRLETKGIELAQGMGAFVYIGIKQPKGAKIPKQLVHKILTDERLPEKGEALVLPMEFQLAVSQEKPVILAHPLKGKNWVASAGPSMDSYHRLTILPFDGKFYLSQRYAIDWMQVCDHGKGVLGDHRENKNWVGYGHEILAVHDGIVTKVHDGIAENIPPKLPVPQLPLPDIAGNHVMLKIHQNNQDYYVLFAHMIPGSIKVKEGDKLKKGQVIGLLGNTGNSSAPHLHIHVCDANDPLKSEGVPFVFKEVALTGNIDEIDLDYGIWNTFVSYPKTVKSLMPINNQVFDFTKDQNKKCEIEHKSRD